MWGGSGRGAGRMGSSRCRVKGLVEVGVLKRWFLRKSSGPGARAQSQVIS